MVWREPLNELKNGNCVQSQKLLTLFCLSALKYLLYICNISKCRTVSHIFLLESNVPQELRSIVNGSHSDADLQNLVHKFVDIFVLCPVCKYPETKLKISTKNKTITHVCKACGAKSMVRLS